MKKTDVFHPPPDPFTLDEVPHLEERAQKQKVDAPDQVFCQLWACKGNEKKNVSARPVSWMRSQFLTSWEAKPKAI